MQETVYESRYGVLKGNKWEVGNPSSLVLIITGMAEYSNRYDKFATCLNENINASVFCLDHFGQGKNGIQGLPVKDFFNKEIVVFKEYIAYLKSLYKEKLPVYIFSHSMGSFMAQAYIEKYSDTIDKVILCGTNGRNPLVKVGAWLSNVIVNEKNEEKDATLLYNLSIGAYDKKFKNEHLKNAWLSFNKENVDKYNEDPNCGFSCSNRFYRDFLNGLASIQKTKNVKNISKDLPILIIGGDTDPVGNFGKGLDKLFKLYAKYDLNVKLKVYPHMRHEILNEDNNDVVYEDIVKFYKGNE